MDLVQLFKGLSDPIRLRITHLLCHQGELCVCHLTEALDLPQSTVSRHLTILRNSGVVLTDRRGKWVYYRMAESQAEIAALIELIKSNAVADQQLQIDLSKLKNTPC